MNTYIYADPHFGHDAIISHTGRPFKNVEEMNNTIINNINKVVKDDDVLYCLGDFCFNMSKPEATYILSRINCKRKILIKGNHDLDPNYMMNIGFSTCLQEAKILIAKEMVTLNHYPYKFKWYKSVWNWLRGQYKKDYVHYRRPKDYGGFLVAGHTHSNVKTKGRTFNACLEANKYTPIPLQAIADWIIRYKKERSTLWGKLKNYTR